jgi:flagellar biosynthesis/type III secretory pathway M-ring protein FliF/YscJ
MVNMKTILTFILLFAIALPCSGLTQQDLEQIERLMDKKLEPIKIDIAEIKGKMATKDDIIAVRKDFTEEMNAFRQEIYAKIDSTNASTNARIDSLYNASIAVWTAIFIAIIAAIFGSPIFNRLLEKREERKNAIIKMREAALKLAKDKPEWAEAYKNIGLL